MEEGSRLTDRCRRLYPVALRHANPFTSPIELDEF